MYYIVTKRTAPSHQMTLEEFLFPEKRKPQSNIPDDGTSTRTYCTETVSQELASAINTDSLIHALERYNEMTESLRQVPRHDLYSTFYIPKKSGGFRKIDAPNEELKNMLRILKSIFEEKFTEAIAPNGLVSPHFFALYHTSGFAYISKRQTLSAVKKHQDNHSRWFFKTDMSNFFGSITKEYVLKQMSVIFPFCEVMKSEKGRVAMETAIDLAFLDGVLPQGTPISPMLTNIVMIPMDHAIANRLRKLRIRSKENDNGEPDGEIRTRTQKFVYTRYADDIYISCRYDFSYQDMLKFICDILREFNAPFSIKPEKTHYGSSSGSNWILGTMLNKDNEITVGRKTLKSFSAAISNFIMDTKNGIPWSLEDIQILEGKRNYYDTVEHDTIESILKKYNEKYQVNVREMIKNSIRNGSNLM